VPREVRHIVKKFGKQTSPCSALVNLVSFTTYFFVDRYLNSFLKRVKADKPRAFESFCSGPSDTAKEKLAKYRLNGSVLAAYHLLFKSAARNEYVTSSLSAQQTKLFHFVFASKRGSALPQDALPLPRKSRVKLQRKVESLFSALQAKNKDRSTTEVKLCLFFVCVFNNTHHQHA